MMTRIHPHGCWARWTWVLGFAGLVAALYFASHASSARAQEANWIWSPEHKKDQVPTESCYFRKMLQLRAPETGTVTIAADDSYELWINGRSVATGSGSKKLMEYDVSRFLSRGRNIIAVKATNTRGSTAALVVRLLIKDDEGKWRSHSSDASWKTSLRPLPLWDTAIYNDSRWDNAQVFGQLGQTVPWDRAEDVAKEQTDRSERFKIAPEFSVQQVVDGVATGSLIAMAFNEFGHVVASREGGPLLLIYDSDKDKKLDKVRVYCDQVKNCQGILPLNGDVFVTADGPEGAALYRLADKDRDGKLEIVKAIVKFKGEMGEHGPHAVALGPDGLLYVVVGNLSSLDGEYDVSSPHQNYYDGDLVARYEDPGGHAVGIKVPGGVVLRTDIEGSVVQLVAGGLRNVYDITFNRSGELFAHDSDMETDEGTPWFRPTQVFHIVPGADYGWRSGWSRWPDYFVDCLPPMLDTGRGSPTGAVAYNHHAFPARYQDTLFLADWSQGRILAVKTKSSGGTYSASSDVFLEGDPLNVTDLDVGPDGALYFVTGGRGTSGGLYRVAWKGQVPAEFTNLGDGISAVIRQPQLQSAWCRQRIAKLKGQLGDRWDGLVEGVARSAANPPEYRTRALDVMQLFGPPPSPELLLDLSKDKSEAVRAKAAELMGLHANDATSERLAGLLKDGDRTVRRKACEALLRAGQTVALADLAPSLGSDDRYEAWAARRLLERLPVDTWRKDVLAHTNQRVQIQGTLALMIAHPDKQNALDVLASFQKLLGEFVSDRNFGDLLRVTQVAIHRGALMPNEADQLRDVLVEEFPAGEALMNRELIRLLTYLQAGSATDRYLKYLKSDAAEIDKFHVALHLRFLEAGWQAGQKLELVEFYENAARKHKETNYPLYVKNVARDFARSVSESESREILAQGAKWPNSALGALYKLPTQLDAAALEHLKKLDLALVAKTDESSKPLKVGLVAVLARSGDPASLAYLREVWVRDPDRRPVVAMGLAQQPDGDNWDYLVRSLALLDGGAAVEVLNKLLTVDQAPEESQYYRHVILRGLELKAHGAEQAVAVLEHWAESPVSKAEDTWEQALSKWQSWFHDKYPDQPEAKLPTLAEDSKYKFEELLEFLTAGDGVTKASVPRGAEVFVKAECIKCHKFGDKGERIGPDLSTLSKRFARKEILESILYPSHVIPDQYAAKTIITNSGRRYTGLVAAGAAGEKIVLQVDGKKVTVRESEIDETVPSKTSAMPAGLLNTLTQKEIADLFAYMLTPPKENLTRRPTGDKTK